MPRPLQNIMDHQDELAEQFEQHEPRPSDWIASEVLSALRDAAAQKDNAESAVAAAREAGYAWGTIGNLIDTTGETVRQRYGRG